MKAKRSCICGLTLVAWLCSLCLHTRAASLLDTNWDNRFGPLGVNGSSAQINAVVWVGTNLYVAGKFTLAGAVAATNIARWDGERWWALGGGLNAAVKAVATDGDNLYAGGQFTSAGGVTADRVAKWDGAHWSALGSPTLGTSGNSVNALLFTNGVLYAGGSCQTLSGAGVTNVGQWDGTQWRSVGGGISGTVYALASDGANLYAGGQSFANGGNIAKWNGSAWLALGTGLTGGDFVDVYALAVQGGNVIAAGEFTTAGGVHATNIASWNGSQWFPLGPGLSGSSLPQVSALLADGANLYAGGDFTVAGAVSVNGLARWNGSAWVAGAVGDPGDVLALAGNGTNLIVGGSFLEAGVNTPNSLVKMNNLARWDGQNWFGFGEGVGGTGTSTYELFSLKVVGSDVYVGGALPTVADLHTFNIARWDGMHWNGLGTGVTNAFGQGYVIAIESLAGQIYAGGNFIKAGSVDVTNIARWDGTNWFAAGSFDNDIRALAAVGPDLYAGGYFVNADGATVKHLARYDGTTWTNVGGGLNGFVYSLGVSGANLFVGGGFTQAGGIAATNIAMWNGSAWTALGPGLGKAGDDVEGIAASPDGKYIYATGQFSSSGSTNWIARWDGQTWTNIGAANAFARALTVIGDNVFAGGGFTTISGVAASDIAGWNGTNWFALGDGLPTGLAAVNALASTGGDLFVGGQFDHAGGQPDEDFGIYNTGLVLLPVTLSLPTRLADGQFQMTVNGQANQNYTVQMSTNLSSTNWMPLWVTNSPSASFLFTDPNATNPAQFYRVLVGP